MGCRGVIGVGSVSHLLSAQLGLAAHCGELGGLPAACLQARRMFDIGLLTLDSSQIPFQQKKKKNNKKIIYIYQGCSSEAKHATAE